MSAVETNAATSAAESKKSAAEEDRPTDEQGDGIGLISHRAEVFRAKMLRKFRLLDAFDEAGAVDTTSTAETPHLQTMDVIEDELMRTTMVTEPQGIVLLQVYSNKFVKAVTADDRRLNRVHNKNTTNPPIDLWASWVVQSNWFQNFILTVLVVNTIILGLQSDLGGSSTPWAILVVFEVIDILSLFIFVTEIILSWIDDFVAFWTKNWNVFDFIITAFCLIIEIIRFVSISTESDSSDLAYTAQSLRSFRILRSLKLIARFKDAREMIVCVTKAIKSIVFIIVLMCIIGYVYAVVAVTFFDYTTINPHELSFPNAFINLHEACKTLFQLFTNDHWIPIVRDLDLVTGNQYAGGLFVSTWLVLSCFIIGSIMTGIIVSSFQAGQDEIRAEEEKAMIRANREDRATEFAITLDEEAGKKLSILPGGTGEQPSPTPGHPESLAARFEGSAAAARTEKPGDMSTEAWTTMVERNLVDLAFEESNFCWPRDTLLRYYVLMETLQENLEERKQLLDLANHAILQMLDV